MQNKIEINLEDHIDIGNGPFLVATGTYKYYEPFRVIYISPEELRLELRDIDTALGEQSWITVSRYSNKLRSSALEINCKELFCLRLDVYKHLLHELLKIYYGKLNYPFEIYNKDYMGAWRIICVGPNQFKWDDVVKNNMEEEVFVARNDPNGFETSNIEDACLFFLKKIIKHTQK